MSDDNLELKWEKLAETGLMNAQNILAVDHCDCYHLGHLTNGKFYIRNPYRMSRFEQIDIVKYVELPELQGEP